MKRAKEKRQDAQVRALFARIAAGVKGEKPDLPTPVCVARFNAIMGLSNKKRSL
jgi:hypothetical protein